MDAFSLLPKTKIDCLDKELCQLMPNKPFLLHLSSPLCWHAIWGRLTLYSLDEHFECKYSKLHYTAGVL
jgi:hypothetical protein